MTGVLTREQERAAYWEALGLPDPIRVLGQERQMRQVHGATGYTSPDRPPLDAHFADHPDDQPRGWG